MTSTTFRRPAVALLATGAVALLAAPPAHATGTTTGTPPSAGGKASAVVLRAGLDVGLLDKAVHLPLQTTLNQVDAPARAEKTALTVRLDGVDQGRPVTVLRADVATSKATADERQAQAEVELAQARVHVPGLPVLSLIEVENVTSKAVCEAGRQPVATSDVLGAVTVLGKKVTLSAGGPTRVEVPGVGEVGLALSEATTTSTTAAAAALRLKVSVNPLKLNVAQVDGEVVLAEARCEAPAAPGRTTKGTTNAGDEPVEVKAQPAGTSPVASGTHANLAETGGSSLTPYLAGGALLLLGAGAGALVLTRSRGRGNA
ncbi:SCO1860 family LAETG-anchored protein [Streptomyces sp. WAC06614]|uniref:SCO1860 family LAETG-anchored protein n=1 Tax=Streptomyces sp. WAC06614 TaxID=2487416 RepID=UPI000F76F598|nr:SCO1860 family LAETG-anchored protein [Streptomyces sp. WAC06614]RSS81283.1 hypothetical protein EF918_10875 [Streptomyces sp. WAC06614]